MLCSTKLGIGSSLSNCALTLSYINGLESREKKEIFHSVWANTDIDNSGRLRRGSLGDIGYSIKLGPLEGSMGHSIIRSTALILSYHSVAYQQTPYTGVQGP